MEPRLILGYIILALVLAGAVWFGVRAWQRYQEELFLRHRKKRYRAKPGTPASFAE